MNKGMLTVGVIMLAIMGLILINIIDSPFLLYKIYQIIKQLTI